MLELLIIDSMNIDAALVLMGLDTPNDLELNCAGRLIPPQASLASRSPSVLLSGPSAQRRESEIVHQA